MQVHVAYQTSGCIAVHDHDALRHLDFASQLSSDSARSSSLPDKDLQNMQRFIKGRKPGQVGHLVLFCLSVLGIQSVLLAYSRANSR